MTITTCFVKSMLILFLHTSCTLQEQLQTYRNTCTEQRFVLQRFFNESELTISILKTILVPLIYSCLWCAVLFDRNQSGAPHHPAQQHVHPLRAHEAIISITHWGRKKNLFKKLKCWKVYLKNSSNFLLPTKHRCDALLLWTHFHQMIIALQLSPMKKLSITHRKS